MEKCIKMWHRLKPIKMLGNGGQTLFPVTTSECIERQPLYAHTITDFRVFLVQLKGPAECSVLLVMTPFAAKQEAGCSSYFLDCTHRVKKGRFT